MREADLLELTVEEPVDAILSTATFHWIGDHDRCSRACGTALKPGGRLVAQCGGAGNVAAVKDAGFALARREPFAEHLADWPGDWNFASPADTEARLRRLGYTRRVVLELARGRRRRRRGGLPGDDLPRLVPRAPARGAARAVRRRRGRAARRAAHDRVRAAEHPGARTGRSAARPATQGSAQDADATGNRAASIRVWWLNGHLGARRRAVRRPGLRPPAAARAARRLVVARRSASSSASAASSTSSSAATRTRSRSATSRWCSASCWPAAPTSSSPASSAPR